MSKIVNITSKEDKDQKLQDIANSLEELKDVMAEVIEAYEEENADSRKMDTLTEALDALEDAYEAVNDVLLEEMQYKVLKIEEDMDFGCEERQPGEALMSVVLMEDENGNETSLRHDDGLLYERDINEGDLVTMDGQHQLWKL